MGDEDDGLLHLGLQFDEFMLHVPPDQGVEGAERLVHEQDVRVHRQGARQADALLHATGELRGIGLFPAFKAYLAQGFMGPAIPLRGIHVAHFEAEGHVFQDGAVGEQGEILEHHAELAAPQLQHGFGIQSGDVLAVDLHATGGGFDEPVDAADQGGFAAAAQAHDHDDLALFHLEGDIGNPQGQAGALEDLLAIEALLQEFERRLCGLAEDLRQIFNTDFWHGRFFAV